MSTGPLLHMDGIAMSYPGRDGDARLMVLDALALEVAPSELVCIAGRSGSGKTTLLNIAAGLLRPTAGEVRWGERALGELTDVEVAHLRRDHIGFVFQSGGLIPILTAAENVALPSLPEGMDIDGRRRALMLLDLVGMANRADHFPSQLSSGEQQRVAVARGLYSNPPMLLVDEPTANLDRGTADGVIALLASLRGDGRGLLVATHDQRLIDRADRVQTLE